MPAPFLTLAGISGFLAVAIGAFAAHGLSDILSAQMLATFDTGVQYQMFHTAALFGVGLLHLQFPDSIALRRSGYLFLAGMLVFSGSLYLLAITGVGWLGAITPLGGLAFLAGWGSLLWFTVREKPGR